MGYRGISSARGDYRAVRMYRGDPGLFGFLGKAIGKVAGAVGSVLPAPFNIPGRLVGRVLGGGARSAAPQQPTVVMPGAGTVMNTRAAAPRVQQRKTVSIDPATGLPRQRRRRMNVTNDKALRRAIRRQAGFVKLARKALQGTGYKIVTKGSGRKVNVREAGPGSVTIQ